MFKLDSAHKSPWVIYDWLAENRPKQFQWFLDNRKLIYTPNPALAIEEYQDILKGLVEEYNKLNPLKIKSKYYKITEEQERELIEAYSTGEESVRNLARKYEVSKTTISRSLKKYRVPIKRNPRRHYVERYSEETINKLISDYLGNKRTSIRDLSKKYHIHSHSVSKIFALNDVPLKPKGWHKKKEFITNLKEVVK